VGTNRLNSIDTYRFLHNSDFSAFYITVIFPLLVIYVSDNPIVARAEDNPYGTPFKIESTAYCYGEITASGQAVREGIAAGRKEWMGLTAILYTDDNGKVGDIIGIYEILDTGGDERIKNGTCIDIYMLDYDDCREWGRKNVWIQIVDAKG
jgi:3D (Asp-Asp-Asp) domain-containing protein